MKISTFFLLSLLIPLCFSIGLQAQNEEPEAHYERLYYLCKIWGQAKYFHSEVAAGAIDWDNELLRTARAISIVDTDEEYNNLILEMLDRAGEMQSTDAELPEVIDSLNNNSDLSWMDAPILSPNLKERIKEIHTKFRPQSNQYVRHSPVAIEQLIFNNDDQYHLIQDYPEVEFRLVALFRFWNMIHYFYPYKNGLNPSWDEVLKTYIPIMVEAKDAVSFNLAFRAFMSHINDSNAFMFSAAYIAYVGEEPPPFNAQMIEENMVITFVIEDYADLLTPGDIITEIDGQHISTIRDSLRKFAYGSYEDALEYRLTRQILRGPPGPMDITVVKNEETITLNLQRSVSFAAQLEEESPAWSTFMASSECKVGLVNLVVASSNEIDDFFEANLDADVLIFDVRGFPKFTLNKVVEYLFPTPIIPYKFLIPDANLPGRLYWRDAPPIGKINDNSFLGEIIILVDEKTRGTGESTIMALEQFPKSTIVGRPTVGASGSRTSTTLPAHLIASFSASGRHYADFSTPHGKGIKLDLEAPLTLNGIQAGKDEILDQAMNFVNCNTTAIATLPDNQPIKIYPNPTSGLIQIDYPQEVTSLSFTIFDITGKTVFQQENLSRGEPIDINSLVSGSYFIQFQNKDTIHSVLIQKL